MRYISEQFKEKQDEIIRPALKMRFELGTDINNPVGSAGDTYLDFDDTVAPIVKPTSCVNEYFYAVVGDNVGVDNPNRICAPDNSESIATPSHSVPYGITANVNANTEAIIGNATYFFYNFTNITSPITLSFKGGVIPDVIRVEKYQNNSWTTEITINNPELNEEVTFTPSNYTGANTIYRRFYVKNTQTGGRFQLNWIRADKSLLNYFNGAPVVFENNYISSVNITKETDLTSQTLPSYQMTITCLDPEGEYTPESEYWNNQFADFTPCYIKAGFDIGGVCEYVPLMYGNLTEKPKYEQGKITFKIAVDWYFGWSTNLGTKLGINVNEGSEILSTSFYFLIYNNKIFESYDVFDDIDDRNNSIFNYYGELDAEQARQLIANALGCYMTSDFDDVVIRKTTDIQYETPEDTIMRFDQVKNSLESKAKVGKISISRNKNTVSSDYVDVETPTRKTVGSSSQRFAVFTFDVPFYANGKISIVDAQATVSTTINIYSDPEVRKKDNGMYEIGIPLTAGVATSIKPIVRFYRVNTDILEETEVLDESAGEVYTNNNTLITNSYIANKAKNVAHFISGLSNQYEVDVLQDFSRDLGDIIRLETEKGVFKTCVITGLKFTLPGSNGHITCRKIFSIDDSKYALSGITNAEIIKYTGGGGLTVLESDNDVIAVGIVKYNNEKYYIVIGASSIKKVQNGSTNVMSPNISITDENNHVWYCYYFNASNTKINFTPVDLGTYNTLIVNNLYAYGAMTLIMKLYEEQNMTSPVNYNCSYTVS